MTYAERPQRGGQIGQVTRVCPFQSAHHEAVHPCCAVGRMTGLGVALCYESNAWRGFAPLATLTFLS